MATIGRYSRAKLQKIISGSAGGGGSGDGDVTGAASSTDNAVVRFNGTGGKTIQNSAVIIDDSNNVSGVVGLTTSGDIQVGADADGTDRIITFGHSTLKSVIGIDDSGDVFAINTDDAFETANDLQIDTNGHVTLGNGNLIIGADADGTDRSITFGHSTLKTTIGVDDSGDVFAINTDDAFETANDFQIDASGHITLGNGNLVIGADSDGTDRTITFGHSTLKTTIGIDDDQDVFAINTDNAFEAGNDFEIDSSGNVTLANGDLYVDKIRRATDSGTTTKILLNDEVLKLYAGHSSNEVVNIANATVTISADVSIPDDKKIYFGDSNEGHIEYNEDLDDFLTISGSNVVLSGSSVVASGEITGSSNFLLGTGASNTFTIDSTGNVSGSGTAQFQSALTASSILVSGGMIRPSEPGGTKLGSPAYEFAEAYFADDKKVYFGSNQDAYIYYDEAVSDYCIISGSANGLVLSGSTVKVDGTLVGGSPLKIGGEGMEFQAGSKLKFPASTALSFSGSYMAIKDDVPMYFGTDHDSYIKFVDSTGRYMEISGSNNGVSISGSHVQIDQTLGVALNGGTITHGITLPNSTTNNSGSIIAHSYATYSSHRYKKKVEIIKNPLEKIKNIQGVSFSWKDTNKKDIGFIAEEVGKIIPEVFNFDQNGQDAMSMDYTRITAILVEGMKEQQIQLDQQKKYISQLQKIIEELKKP